MMKWIYINVEPVHSFYTRASTMAQSSLWYKAFVHHCPAQSLYFLRAICLVVDGLVARSSFFLHKNRDLYLPHIGSH